MFVATDEREYLTLQEASERFGIAVRTLRAWRSRRWVTRYDRRDGVAMVDAAEIQRVLDDRKEVIKRDDQEADGD